MRRNFKLKFRGPTPKMALEKIKKALKLPMYFCGVCSLREGVIVVIVVAELLSSIILTLGLLALMKFPLYLDEVWSNKLEKDFKPYFAPDDSEYASDFISVWRYVTWTAVGITGSYIFSGFGVIFAILDSKAHPAWNIPWLLQTFILLLTCAVLVLTMMAFAQIFMGQRELIITSDLVPVTGIFVIGCFWTYGFCIVLAHVKRQWRMRVKPKKGKKRDWFVKHAKIVVKVENVEMEA